MKHLFFHKEKGFAECSAQDAERLGAPKSQGDFVRPELSYSGLA